MQELIILICLTIATLVLKIKFKEKLYHSNSERIAVTLIILVIMIGWEYFSTQNNIWFYPGTGMLGIYVLGLPIELYYFYLILPYFVFLVFDLIHRRQS
ncbi:MAG: lycopene cyclase domain-containing protein [Patescibacteria group bacterium]